ncbi:putative zinc-/iron-chelating domain protein [Yersinia rochesterensis]|uniref:YkgJ family cysteine cluster protein n=1 Tax=Yersinia rochesterensis TaxID=1604335 RepID=A0A386HBV4_9GAMM|nr:MULTISPECIES: flagellin lysine-N-methylase [Yersinia]AJI85384.1 flagellar biosynthetic fliU domain protein [Yersinia frederiksenii Y225]CNH02332.1 FliB family protein [Yersinia kristensenii]AIN17355.1 putative zinc-/iron-chelating domain protein [Yersinia rochesterensis]AJJ34082.1 putative zinc-/iron-chelating domain protein [Yersinia rochesterensis]AYD43257.1 YkgJ family cysteine cluster protein [Yersinia rochesterensis]
MKELLITQPDFMETFNCVGTACREHCCKGQNVTLDRNRYQKYIKSPYADIKRIAISHISVTQDSLASWANIHPDSQGCCPFLDEQQLCQIHKHAGANALSNCCATYPRIEHIYKNQKIKSMSLSCPEVTRKVLFSPEALTLRFSTIHQYDYYKAPDIIIDQRLANRACVAIIAASEESNVIEESLWAINLFLQMDLMGSDVNKNKMAEIDSLRAKLISAVASGKAADALMAIDYSPAIRCELLDYFRHFMAQMPDIRGKNVLAAYANTLQIILSDKLTSPKSIEQKLSDAWHQYALPFFMQHNSVLRNYFLYRIHHDQLAMGDKSAVAVFNLQVIDFFFLKALISAHVSHHGEITESHVIDIIYSYHACRDSTDNSSQKFKQDVMDLALKEDFPLLSLLT